MQYQQAEYQFNLLLIDLEKITQTGINSCSLNQNLKEIQKKSENIINALRMHINEDTSDILNNLFNINEQINLIYIKKEEHEIKKLWDFIKSLKQEK